jgi:hypothetical protein
MRIREHDLVAMTHPGQRRKKIRREKRGDSFEHEGHGLREKVEAASRRWIRASGLEESI